MEEYRVPAVRAYIKICCLCIFLGKHFVSIVNSFFGDIVLLHGTGMIDVQYLIKPWFPGYGTLNILWKLAVM